MSLKMMYNRMLLKIEFEIEISYEMLKPWILPFGLPRNKEWRRVLRTTINICFCAARADFFYDLQKLRKLPEISKI